MKCVTGEKGATRSSGFEAPKTSNLEHRTSNLPLSRLDRVETPAVSCPDIIMRHWLYAV